MHEACILRHDVWLLHQLDHADHRACKHEYCRHNDGDNNDADDDNYRVHGHDSDNKHEDTIRLHRGSDVHLRSDRRDDEHY